MAQFMFRRILSKKISSSPQAETEKITIPYDGEVQLKNTNLIPSSVVVKDSKTSTTFSAAEGKSIKKNKYFLLPEDGVLFFDPSDAGRKVTVEYDWSESAEEEEEDDTSSFDDEEEEDDEDDEDEESEESASPKKKKKTEVSKKDNPWSLDSEWFHYEPLSVNVEVNNSLKSKLQKGVDFRRGVKALHLDADGKDTGVEYKVRPGSGSKTPSAGEVVYNYQTGVLHWPEEANGKKFRVEFFLNGQEGKKKVELDKEVEFERIESFKEKASDLWTRIFMHPDPEFVSDTLIPLVENEIDALTEKVSGISSDEKRTSALSDIPDLTGEFIDLEHLLSKLSQDPSEDNKDTVRDFVSSEISPKLSKMYSLASLIAERIYDLQTEEDDEDFPEFGDSGARVLDLDTLRYMKGVRQEANNFDEDLVDFSKYYTGLLLSWIRDPQTYVPGSSLKSFKPIADVFDKANISLADLHSVALNEFRKSVLSFDREKRDKETTPNPVDFRLHGSPIKSNVRSALRQMYNRTLSEVKDYTTRSGTKTVTIPQGGGRVDLGASGFRKDDLVVTGPGNKEFLPADANLMATEEEGRKKSSRVKIVVGPQPGRTSEISVMDPERGVKLTLAEGQAHKAENKEKLKGNKDIFFFASSSGIIWLDEYYRGKKLLVQTRNSSSGPTRVGKDEYLALPESGVIEFSAENSGEEVVISYTQKVRSKRFVSPTITSDEEGESTSLIDMVEDTDADPLSKELASLSEENVNHALEVIADILMTQDDPRLDDKDRAMLSGILGVGQANDAKLSLQEIGAKAPFSGKESLSELKDKKKAAVESLLSILREKAKDDKTLLKTLLPMKKVLTRGFGDSEPDKILLFLRQEGQETGKVPSLLNSLLLRSNLKPDEENVLRWVWAVPGNLRREHLEESDAKVLPDSLPSGTSPAYNIGERLQEIASSEFGADTSDDGDVDPGVVELVKKTYERALKKTSTILSSLMSKNEEFFSSKYPEFKDFFSKKHSSQSLAEEILSIERDEYAVDEEKVRLLREKREEKEAPQKELNRKPLFDQLKTSLPGVDDKILKTLMEEALAAHKSGKSFSDLIDKREKAVGLLAEKGASFLEEKTRKAREEIMSLQDEVENTKSQVNNISADIEAEKKNREAIRARAVQEAGEEYQAKIDLAKAKLSALVEILAATQGDGESLNDMFSAKSMASLQKGERDENGKVVRGPVAPSILSVYQEYSSLADADTEDLTQAREILREDIEEAREELKTLRKEAVSFADKETRSELRKSTQQIKKLESDRDKFSSTLRKQDSDVAEKKENLKTFIDKVQSSVQDKIKEQSASKELDLLLKVNDFLSDRDDLQRGDGTYNLDNMFEVQKPKKPPGYSPPSLPEGEEDTYRPLQEEIKPVHTTKNPSKPLAPSPEKKPKDKQQSKSIDSLTRDFAAGSLSGEEFLKSITPHKKRLPDAAIAALSKYSAGDMSVDSAASAVADAISQYAKEVTEDKAKFAPRGKQAPAVKRSLLEDLQAVAVEPDPDEDNESYQKRLRNFKILMLALRNHFKNGGDIRKFSPQLPQAQTLSDQKQVIRSVAKFLLENAEDLRTGKGSWDLSDLQKPLRVTPLESLPGGAKFAPVDLSDRAKSAEQLHNAQSGLSKEEAEKLNDIIRMVSSGKSLTEIVKGLGKSKSIEGKGTLSLATRLALFINRHNEIKTEEGWNFQSLYTGEHTLPTKEDVKGYMPLESHMTPLIDSLQKEMQEESGPDGGTETAKDTRERVLDMLHRMSEFAMYDMSLEDMESEFASMDKSKAKPYSMSYLFQKVRNFLSKINRSTPLSKMRNDYGLSPLFDTGVPIGAPSEQDEIDSVNEEDQAVTKWSKDFSAMVEEQELTDAEAETAGNILSSLQLRMDSGTHVVELINRLTKARPDLSGIIMKVLKHIGKNKSKYDSGIPGVPDFSSLTGIPFKTLHVDESKGLSDKEKNNLKNTIFDDMVKEKELDEFHANLFSDLVRAMKENPGKSGLNKIVKNSVGTDIEDIASSIAQFLIEKGLDAGDGSPDTKGIKLPPIKGRPRYVDKDGVPDDAAMMKDLGISEEDLQEEFDDLDDSMPEPGPDFVDVDDFIEDVRDSGQAVPPEAEEALDFFAEDDAPSTPVNKDRLYASIFGKMAEDFDFDDDEEAVAAFILREITKKGVDAVLANIRKANPELEVILQDILDYLNENGVPSSDIGKVVLPDLGGAAEEETEDSSDPVSFSPTFRIEVPDNVLHSVLRAGLRAQKGGDLNVVDFIRRLEGVVDPDTAKNVLLQGIEEGFVAVQGTEFSGTGEDATFLPVTEDGTPLVSVKVLRTPQKEEPKAPPADSAGMPEPESRPRGRMPKELASLPIGVDRYSFIAKAIGLTPKEAKDLDKEVGRVQAMTFSELSSFWKKNRDSMSAATTEVFQKYIKGLTTYLRLVQEGRDPLGTQSPAPAEKRMPGEWRNDEATPKQVEKIRSLSLEITNLGEDPSVDVGESPSKGEASDAINSLKAQLQRMQEAAPVPKAPKAAPAAPQKQQPASPVIIPLEKQKQLYDLALSWLTANEIPNAQAFSAVLSKKKPELLPTYTVLIPKIQKALDAINADDLDIDLSGF